jgi:hypothetical protein
VRDADCCCFSCHIFINICDGGERRNGILYIYPRSTQNAAALSHSDGSDGTSGVISCFGFPVEIMTNPFFTSSPCFFFWASLEKRGKKRGREKVSVGNSFVIVIVVVVVVVVGCLVYIAFM